MARAGIRGATSTRPSRDVARGWPRRGVRAIPAATARRRDCCRLSQRIMRLGRHSHHRPQGVCVSVACLSATAAQPPSWGARNHGKRNRPPSLTHPTRRRLLQQNRPKPAREQMRNDAGLGRSIAGKRSSSVIGEFNDPPLSWGRPNAADTKALTRLPWRAYAMRHEGSAATFR